MDDVVENVEVQAEAGEAKNAPLALENEALANKVSSGESSP